MTREAYAHDYAQVTAELEGLKRNLRITTSDLDADLTGKLLAAVAQAEAYIGGKIIKASVSLSTDYASTIALHSPVQEVDSVMVDGVEVTDYDVTEDMLVLGEGVHGRRVEVLYTTGLDDIPYDMRAAIYLYAGALFNNPVDSVEALPQKSFRMLRHYRKYGD